MSKHTETGCFHRCRRNRRDGRCRSLCWCRQSRRRDHCCQM